jgi:hypothetical protein
MLYKDILTKRIECNGTVFLMIWKRDRDRRVHERPHKNAQG